MNIFELTQGQIITIFVNTPDQKLEFNTNIEDVYPKKKILLAAPIYINDKLLTFRGTQLIFDILVCPTDGSTPQLFKNVSIKLVKKADGSVCYSLYAIAESKAYNRRGAFRCSIGLATTVQCGMHRVPYDAVIKDISTSGFSFILPKTAQVDPNGVVHMLVNDYIEENAERYNFNLYGLIVRSYELDAHRIVYGCKLNSPVQGLEKYLMTKERIRMRNVHWMN